MNVIKSRFVYHLMAIITVAIWGTTFVSTKILIQHGLSPSDIFFYRFTMAYLCMWCISYKKLFANRVKDELLLLLAGLCGGTIYFMALIGVGLVVFNGSFILKINPLGDILSLTAALMWAFYCLILKQLDNHYSIVFITRKVFFYGVLTILPMFLFRPLNWDNVLMMQPIVFGNLLFLGFVASMLCFIAWNACVKELGAVKSTNYIYIVPLVTLLTSAVIINEKITWIALTGCFLILCGVYLAERKTNPTFEAKS